jgi:hypothetical protein
MGSHIEFLTLNTSEFPRDAAESSLLDVLEKMVYVFDFIAKGWELPMASRVLTDAFLRSTFKQTY